VITGQDLRAAREARGVGLGKLAERIGRSKGHLSKVERGVDDRGVTPALIRDYERALGVAVSETSNTDSGRTTAPAPTDERPHGDPIGDNRADVVPAEATNFDSLLPAPQLPIGEGWESGVQQHPYADIVDSRRRMLLRGIASVALASGLLVRHGHLPSRQLGVGDVSRLNAVTALYRSLDYECGGGMLFDEVATLAESASSLLDLSYSKTLRPSLLAAVANTRQLAGWTAFDAGKHSDAQRHWLSAERAAVQAGDAKLTARVRYCQARQFQHLRHNGDALETLRLARHDLSADSTPAISAMLWGAEAASLAALGDTRSALGALAKASGEFEQINSDEPEWMRFYDRGELFAQYGRVYRDLARADSTHGPSAVYWGNRSDLGVRAAERAQ
jgi:transcriptional regulator with XRE-family HTH domain